MYYPLGETVPVHKAMGGDWAEVVHRTDKRWPARATMHAPVPLRRRDGRAEMAGFAWGWKVFLRGGEGDDQNQLPGLPGLGAYALQGVSNGDSSTV